MPYKDQWKRTEAVRRFRRRQRERREQSRQLLSSRPILRTVIPAPSSNSPLQPNNNSAGWMMLGISALTVLAAITGRKSR